MSEVEPYCAEAVIMGRTCIAASPTRCVAARGARLVRAQGLVESLYEAL